MEFKTNLIGLIFLFTFANIYGQTAQLEIRGKTETDNDFVYLLVNNGIKLLNVNCDSSFLITNNGTIVKENSAESCYYIFRPTKYETATIFHCKIVKGDTLILREKKISVRPVPFVATMKGRPGYLKLEKKILLTYPIRVEAFNTDWNAALKITSLCLTVIRNNELLYYQFYNDFNSTIFEEMKADFSVLQSNDFVYFTEIHYNYFGYDLISEDLVIRIK